MTEHHPKCRAQPTPPADGLHVVIGAGPICLGIAETLAAAERSVRVVTRSGEIPVLRPAIHSAQADASDAPALTQACDGASVIYFAAAPPPPVDCQDRRALGDDMHLITDAVLAGRRRHPSPVPVDTLIGQFWERFTGGDIAYASGQIRINPATPAYPAFRRQSGGVNADLFHVAHRHLTRTAAVEGPLTWRPRLLPPAGPDYMIMLSDRAQGI